MSPAERCDLTASKLEKVHDLSRAGGTVPLKSPLLQTIIQKIIFVVCLADRLKVRVKELSTRLVQSNGSSHISGQFEWVDGQLVKALKNGHWLLIDNVNFCRYVIWFIFSCKFCFIMGWRQNFRETGSKFCHSGARLL